MCKKVKVINNSSRELPEEAIDAITYKTLSEANNILAEYNLKIVEMERELDNGHLLSQTITIADTNWLKD